MLRHWFIAAVLVAPAASHAADPDPFADYSGAQLFGRFCASCHGSLGYGDGPVAPSLKVMIPDLTELSKRSGGRFPDERVREIIDGRAVLPAHGTRPMPVWGYELEARAGAGDVPAEHPRDAAQTLINRLVDHLRSMQR
ncbi:MAG: c-type cytochrome [Chromatiales bacterium]|nr:c-type cytochrome [Chromatiales bacterium]